MSEKAPRPGQATFASWLIIGGSVILVVTAWQRISSLHTLEVQEELQRVLSEPPLSGTGLGFEGLKTTIRVLCMVAAGAATASTILGVQALRRSTSARLALTLLAPLVLIGGFATAGFFAPLVVAGVAMLWLRPTRDWFAGRPWVPGISPTAPRRPDPFAVPERDATPPTAAPSPPPPSSALPPTSGGSAPGPFAGRYGEPLPEPGSPIAPYQPAAKRPGALIAACVIVWVSSAIVAGFLVLMSVVLAAMRDEFFDEVRRQQPGFDMRGMSETELATSVFVMTGFAVIWCLIASVVAVFALRRQRWARIALTVNCGGAALVFLGMTLLSPPLVVLLAAASVSLWLLLRPDVAAWFAQR